MENAGNINGCEIGTYSRTARKCRQCIHKEYCSHKKIEAAAYIIGIDRATEKDFTGMTPNGRNIASMAGITANEAVEAVSRLSTLWQKVNEGAITPNEARTAAGLKKI